MRPTSLVGAASAIAAALSLLALARLAPPAFPAPRLDARFGDGGIARARFQTRQELLAGPLRPFRQADGKVIVAAQADPDHGNTYELLLARFTRAGSPDRSFGHRGRVRLISSFPQQFQPLTVSADREGRIVLVGTVGGYIYFGAAPSQLGILRLLPDGSRDRSFGPGGMVVWSPPGRTAGEWTFPGSFVRLPGRRLLVGASVYDPRLRGSPTAPPPRAVLVRLQRNGSLDQSFGHGGVAEVDVEGGNLGQLARLADGRLASVVTRNEGRAPTLETTAWWLNTFALDGSSPLPLHPTSSVPLGLDVLDGLYDLLPTRDGGLIMVGAVDVERPSGPDLALRRVRPGGSLDPSYGRGCSPPLRRLRGSFVRGAAPTSDGGVFITATKLLIHARPRRIDGFVIVDAVGCMSGTPLRLRSLTLGPPLLQGSRSGILGATFGDIGGGQGLAVVKIRLK
jgi:uncharacterized delta-60 repeat protein